MTFDDYISKYNGQLVDTELSGWMNTSMLSSGKDNKIFNTVVVLEVVNMVNNLIAFKKSSLLFFHYQSVFSNTIVMSSRMIGRINHNIFSLIGYSTLPVVVVLSLVKFTSAFISTEFSKTSRFIKNVVLFAVEAPKMALTRKIIAFPATGVGLIRGRSFEVNPTPFASKDHVWSIPNTMKGVNIA